MKERIQNIKTLFGSPKKVISILSVIAMVLSVFITPLMDLPAGRSPGTGKVYAATGNLTGTAYAVFNSNTGELDFIRSTESHKNGDTGTIKNIDGKSFTGTIYTGFEENKKSYTYNSSYSSYNNTNPVLWEDIQTKVLKVNFVDDISPCTIANWFSNMNNCKVIDLAKLITSNVVDMSYLFYNCTNLSSLNLSNFDTSNVTNMTCMFYGCENVEALDLRNFDTSNVTEMISMFLYCKSVRTLDLSNFDTSNVTKMGTMFYGCENLVSLNVDKFDTSKVTNMANMFCNCKNLRSLNVNSFDTSNVMYMGEMFKNCTSLKALDLNNFDNTSAVCNEMFSGDSALSKITLGNKFTVHLGYFGGQRNCFPTPIATFSGGSSSGTWGLGSETAAKVYTATELDTLGTTAGALAGTWYAQAATYAIKFDPNGGTGTMANETMTVGKAQALTANAFTRTGYLFKSWNTKQDGSGTSYADKASVKDLGAKGSTVTLYAQWEPKTYKNTITHWLYGFKNQEGNNGSKEAFHLGDSFFEGVFGKGTTLDSSKGITLPNGISLSNYLGYTDPTTGKWVSRTIPNTVTQPDKAMTYQLNYSPIAYKLTYNLLGGSNDSANPSSYNVLYGVTLKNAKRTGYTFNGWTDKSGKKVTGINEGANATFSSPDDLYSKLAARLTGDITLNANWTANDYTVKFSANGGSGTMADEGMTYDTSKALTANSFKKTGYTFSGWNTKADGSGTTYADKASVKNLVSEKGGTVTLYAQWKANTYTVKFDPNGGSGTMTDQSVQYDSNFVTTKNAFTKQGYKFNGWNEKADGTGTAWKLTGAGIYENGDGAHPWKWTYDKDVTLYAQWTPNTYTVKFDPNRGTGTMANETMTYDTAKALTANSFTNKDYDFIGWNTKADGSGAFYTDKASVKNIVSSGTVTLYAQWNYNPHVFLPKSGGKGVITIGLVSAFCILAYAEREILKKRKEVR